MKIAMGFLIGLIILSLNGCALFDTTPNLRFKIPTPPEMPVVVWERTESGAFYISEAGARDFLKTQILQEGYIEKLRVTINECNNALNK